MITPKAAAIKWNRLSPIQGMKRIFSLKSIEELFRYTVKVVVSLVILFYALEKNWLELPALVETGAHRIAAELYRMTFLVLVAFLPLYALLAAADYLFQRFILTRSLRMSRTEIKEETKETEGDPHVRARIRSIQRAMARRRMMSKIRQATVVITNPTHFAVALKYDPETMSAPVVVAKGMDEIALRIREVAGEVGVPVVEDPPLARGLYRDCPLDREIPVEISPPTTSPSDLNDFVGPGKSPDHCILGVRRQKNQKCHLGLEVSKQRNLRHAQGIDDVDNSESRLHPCQLASESHGGKNEIGAEPDGHSDQKL